MTSIKKGARVEFENGLDTLRGVVVGKHIDPKRPDMEETWTVFADSVLDETPALDDGKPMMEPGEPRIGRDGAPVIDSKGNPKLTSVPVIYKEWVALVNEDGVQAVDHDGVALHWGKGGAPLQLVKNGVPVPFRVRARRMTVL